MIRAPKTLLTIGMAIGVLAIGATSASANGWMFFKKNVRDVANGTVVFGFYQGSVGAYLPGVKITVQHPNSRATYVLRSDQQGRFRTQSLGMSVKADSLSVRTEKPGYQPLRQMKRLARKGSDYVEVDVVLTRAT